jgi:hypothetical protein
MNKSAVTNKVVQAATMGMLALATPAVTQIVRADDSPAVSAPDRSLTGAWVLVGTPDHVGKAPSSGGRLAIISGSHWCITQADAKSGIVLFHHGGTYTLNGDAYQQTVEFANPTTMNFIGKTNGHFTVKVEGDKLTNIGLDNPYKEVWQRLKPADSKAAALARLNGTWVYAGKPGETNAAVDDHRLKFCADGYWCDTGTDTKTGVVVIHHGGTYTLKGDRYVETCKYANPITMELIGRDVEFDIKIEGDTLTMKGIGNPWNEVWKRLD